MDNILSDAESQNLLFVGVFISYSLSGDKRLLFNAASHARQNHISLDQIAAQGLYALSMLGEKKKARIRQAINTLLKLTDERCNPIKILESNDTKKNLQDLINWAKVTDKNGDLK